MPKASKQRFEAAQAVARRLISAIGGPEAIDSMEPDAARHVLIALRKQLMEETGLRYQAARDHIARAMRRKRNPDAETASNWGGKRR